MKKLRVFRFRDISFDKVTGYDSIYVYAESYSEARELFMNQFPFVINEYNYDERTGRDQYNSQELKKIYPQMYRKPNYLIINNPRKVRKVCT